MRHYDLSFPFLQNVDNPHQRETKKFWQEEMKFLIIGPDSPVRWLKAVEKIGNYFRREMKFDFAPFDAKQFRYLPDLHRDRVVVFYEDKILDRESTSRNPRDFNNVYICLGAIYFRSSPRPGPSSWTLAWIWLHPYKRHQGILSGAWQYLMKMFPNPHIETPISLAMTGFLKKMNQEQGMRKRTS
jgi:hypothetical protein